MAAKHMKVSVPKKKEQPFTLHKVVVLVERGLVQVKSSNLMLKCIQGVLLLIIYFINLWIIVEPEDRSRVKVSFYCTHFVQEVWYTESSGGGSMGILISGCDRSLHCVYRLRDCSQVTVASLNSVFWSNTTVYLLLQSANSPFVHI